MLSLNEVESMIQSRQEEYLHLDFKTITKPDLSEKSDRQNYAKALSGFANSDGGLIIWGVEASKNDRNIDCARGIKPITDAKLFLSRLNSLCGDSVSPIVEGIQNKLIELSCGSDNGIVATLIPPSDSGPHMAKSGEDRYYKRSGDSFYKMEHFDIEDMFGRRKKPKLELYTKIVIKDVTINQQIPDKKYEIIIVIGLENKGRGIALYPYLKIKPSQFYLTYLNSMSNYEGLKRIPHPGYNPGYETFIGNADDVIHPDTFIEITSIKFNAGSSVNQNTLKGKEIKLEYSIAAENMKLMSGEKNIKVEDYVEEFKRVFNI